MFLMVSLDLCGGLVRRGWVTAFPFWGCGNGRSGAPNHTTPTWQSRNDSWDVRSVFRCPALCCFLLLFLTLRKPALLSTLITHVNLQWVGSVPGSWGYAWPMALLLCSKDSSSDTCTSDRITEPIMINTKRAQRWQKVLSSRMRK